jgi:uncharacterized membrane protein YozB (DUF420 family)
MDIPVILLSQVNLVLEIIILMVLFAAFALKRKGKFLKHGSTMLAGVVLNILSFAIVMGPALFSLGQNGLFDHPGRLYFVTLAHAGLGGTALVLGVLLVASWHLQTSTQSCMRRKKIMRLTFVLWVLALILGILLYTLLYTLA